MRTYVFKAFSPEGRLIKGLRQSDSKQSLSLGLFQEGYQPISCHPYLLPSFLFRPSICDIQPFFLYLSSLIKAGFDLQEALCLYEGPQKIEHLAHALLTSLRQGKSLTDSLHHSHVFLDTSLYAILEVGEKNGNLADAFERISQSLLAKAALTKEMVKTLFYPLCLLGLVLSVVYFLLSFVVPEMQSFLLSTGADLSSSAHFLLQISQSLSFYFPLIFLFISVLWGGLWLGSHLSTRLALALSKLGHQLPVLGPLLVSYDILRFIENLSLLLRSGVSLIKALEIASHGLSRAFSNALHHAQAHIIQGTPLSKALEGTGLFSSRFICFLKAGEISGDLESLLSRYQHMHAQEHHDRLRFFLSLLEPSCFLLVGGLLVWIVGALFLPLYEHLAHLDF